MARKKQNPQQEQQPQEVQEPLKVVIDDTIDTPEQAAATSTADKVESLKGTVAAQAERGKQAADEYARTLAQNAPAVADALQGALSAISQEELQQLMQLPLSQIDLLPDEKKEAVFAEMGRQIVEIPGFVEGIQALAEAGQRAAQNFEKIIRPAAQSMRNALENFSKWTQGIDAAMERMRAAVNSLLSDDTRQALQTWAILAPYIEAEADEHPEKYGEQATEPASADELIRAAARRARADGKDIPPLKVEEPEQLEIEMTLPAQEETIEVAEEPETTKEETPAALIEKLKKMPVLNPQAHIMPNNALMNAMQQSGAFNAGELALPVIPAKGRQKEIAAYTIINYEPETSPGETGITITDPKLTEYERNVSNAIISLWVEAEKLEVEPVFTTDTIYRAMPGGGETASPQQKGAITKAFEKFRRIKMTIDATDELRKRGAIKSSETFRLDDYYFNVRRAQRTSKHSGQSVTAYQMIGKPVILQYAEMTGQILSVPAKHLTIRKIDKNGRISTELVTMNADRQAITGYMMRRIAVMKHDLEAARDRLKSYERKRKQNPEQELPQKPLAAFRQQSNVILFDTLFAQVGIATADRKQLMLYRNFCYDVLEYWKATGFVKGYTEQNKGRKITGIAIEV